MLVRGELRRGLHAHRGSIIVFYMTIYLTIESVRFPGNRISQVPDAEMFARIASGNWRVVKVQTLPTTKEV